MSSGGGTRQDTAPSIAGLAHPVAAGHAASLDNLLWHVSAKPGMTSGWDTHHRTLTLFCQLSTDLPPSAFLGLGLALAHHTPGFVGPPAWAPGMCTAQQAGSELHLACAISETGPQARLRSSSDAEFCHLSPEPGIFFFIYPLSSELRRGAGPGPAEIPPTSTALPVPSTGSLRSGLKALN